jgi:hypothetical protein
MQIADGRKTVEQVRSGKAESMKRLRANVSSPRGEETSEPANGTKPPKHKSTSQDQRELEAVRAYAADLEAALEHDGDLAEKLREAEIRMAGMASEIEELKTAADAGADLIDRALNLVSRMSDAERAQFLVKVKQAYPPRRGRPRKRPQAEAEGSIMTAALDIPATLAPAHDSGDGLDIPECLKRVAP